LAPYYSHTGCPSVDPELMIRVMLLGFCYSIRSDRRLCQEAEWRRWWNFSSNFSAPGTGLRPTVQFLDGAFKRFCSQVSVPHCHGDALVS